MFRMEHLNKGAYAPIFLSELLMKLNYEFIKRAEKITSFNITTADLMTTDYKKEVQHLIIKHFFPSLDTEETIKGVNFTEGDLNRVITKLKSISASDFNYLFNYNLKAIGPGEVMLYFILNEARLGGGSSAGGDIFIGGTGYEVKASSISTNGEAYGFKIGGTLSIPEYIVKIDALRQDLKLAGSKTEIPPTILKEMKEKAPERFNIIEKNFAKMAYEGYFKLHKTIFINNNKSSKIGNIEAIKSVQAKDISLYHVTGGTIKPKVKL